MLHFSPVMGLRISFYPNPYEKKKFAFVRFSPLTFQLSSWQTWCFFLKVNYFKFLASFMPFLGRVVWPAAAVLVGRNFYLYEKFVKSIGQVAEIDVFTATSLFQQLVQNLPSGVCYSQCCGSASHWCGSRSDLSLWCTSGSDSSLWCGSGSGFWFYLMRILILFDAYAKLDADFHPDAVPDPRYKIKTQNLLLVICKVMRIRFRIRIQLITLMRIRIFIWCGCGSGSWYLFDTDPDPQHWS